MALNSTGNPIDLLVLKQNNAGSTKVPLLYTVTNEDLNKFDFAKAECFAQWDGVAVVWRILLIDRTSYFP